MTSALTLTMLSVVGTLGFVRIFADTGDVVPPLLATLLTHGIAAVAQRRRWLPPVALAATGCAVALLATWTLASETTSYGIPTTQTFSELSRLFGEGMDAIRTERAPVENADGLVLVATWGMWLAAFAAHSVAFLGRGVLSAAIPVLTLFTLTSALGTSDYQVMLTVALVVTGLAFVLTHSPAQAIDTHAWFSGGGGARRSVVAAGLPVVLLAAAAAPLLGPRFPEARSVGLVDWQGGGGGPRTRVTVSPLVDIRDRLTQRPPVDAFVVRAEEPAYWRLAALETYDGEIWSSVSDFRSASRSIPSDGNEGTTRRLVQEYQITGLQQFWLPAAYRPVAVSLDDARVNVDSLTLLTERETAVGLSYRVDSEIPAYTPGELAAAAGTVSEAVLPQLSVPDTVAPAVRDLALDVAGAEPSPYRRALLLQEFFRTQFTYSEEVGPGHSDDHLAHFLFASRSGYCEQFASAFGVMARILGIPARVAVGFTPGTLRTDGSFSVSSDNAHAWPEVWLAPFGWVAFEPTPGRGNPAPGDHTGTGSESGLDQTPAEDPTVPTQVPQDQEVPTDDAVPPTVPPEGGSETSAQDGNPWPRRLAAAAALTLLGGVAAAGLRLEQRRRARLRREAAEPARAAVLAAWEQVVEDLRLEGFVVKGSDTVAELADAAWVHDPALGDPMHRLRHLVDAAAYGSAEPLDAHATEAWTAARRVVGVLERDDARPDRVRRALGLARRVPKNGDASGPTRPAAPRRS